MGLFHLHHSRKTNTSTSTPTPTTEQKPHRPTASVRDLYARSYMRWVEEGNAEPKGNGRRSSSFDEKRARRAAVAERNLMVRT
ncbi:hypothetical protein PMZ80_010814 [Knufia obscura]|uniref:Uncharacterized protein n=1 Tax=Knufia obscura TaxID=1635080 RepID=A0ABR0R8I8_9EURO|nr:hypothetical protein PMZ80_010814 [Knufia obscura]